MNENGNYGKIEERYAALSGLHSDMVEKAKTADILTEKILKEISCGNEPINKSSLYPQIFLLVYGKLLSI